MYLPEGTFKVKPTSSKNSAALRIKGSVNTTTMGTTFYRKITGVNTSAKTVEIDIPIRYYMKTRDNARIYKVSPKQTNVGLCDFSIGNKANSNRNGWGEEDYKMKTIQFIPLLIFCIRTEK